MKKIFHPAYDYLLLFSAFIFFYLFKLGSIPLLDPDEGRYGEVVREMLQTHDFITPQLITVPFLHKPILVYWLALLPLKLLGVNEFALRLIPAVLAILLCLAIYACARLLYDRATGIFASGILACTPLFFGAAHYFNMDLAVTVFISLALLCALLTIENSNRKIKNLSAYGFWLFVALALLTKGLIGIVLPFAILFLSPAAWKQWRNFKPLQGILLFLLISLPWFILVQWHNPEFFHYFFIKQHFSRFLQTTFNNVLPWWFYLPVIFLGFLPWSIFLVDLFFYKPFVNDCFAKTNKNKTLFLFTWFGVILLFFSLTSSKIVGYILPVFPPLALLCGRGFSVCWQQLTRPASVHRMMFYTLVSCLLALPLIVLFLEGKDFAIGHDLIISAKMLTPFLTILKIILSVNLLCIVLLRKKWRFMLSLFIFTMALLLLSVYGFSERIVPNDVKKAAATIEKFQQPHDHIVSYHDYFFSLPFYLNRLIYVVTDNWQDPLNLTKDNWREQLGFGLQYRPASRKWLINDIEFWRLWQSHQRVWVLINKHDRSQFANKTHHQVSEFHEVLLLTNFPTTSH